MIKLHKKAFTLIELLVVVAIIGLLAGATFSAIDAARVKARAGSIVYDLTQIEKAFKIDFLSRREGSGGFPHDRDICPSGCSRNNPQINQLVSQGLIYIEDPIFPDVNRSYYRYDNDNNTFDPNDCPVTANSGAGVNVYLHRFLLENGDSSYEIAEVVDEMIDGGDGLQCGRFRREGVNSSSMFFMIGANSQDL